MAAGTKKLVFPFPRQPSLAIAGVPGSLGRRLAILEERHPLYSVAALVFHRGDAVEHETLRALYAALLAGWPRKQGARPDEYNAYCAAVLASMGASAQDIAREWHVHVSTARKRIRRGQERLALRDPDVPNTIGVFTVEIVISREDAERIARGDPMVLAAPLDPGSDDFLVKALEFRLPWDGVDDAERADDVTRTLNVARRLPGVQFIESSDI
jgi:hypothetical protein